MDSSSPVVTWLAKLLVNKTFALSVIGFIVAWTVVVAFMVRRRTESIRRELAELSALVAAHDKASFAAKFEEISSELTESTLVGHAWSEFLETLVPGSLWPKPEVANTKQPTGYFDLEAILERRMDRRFYASFPNVLVGLGLIFTFLGLAAGVQLSSSGLVQATGSGEKAADLSATFGLLLGGAFLSFAKSATGIFCSIAISFYDNHRVWKVERALGEFTGALDRNLTFVTPERFALEQLVVQREQLDVVRSIAQIENTLLTEQIAAIQSLAEVEKKHVAVAESSAAEGRQVLEVSKLLLREAEEQTGQLKHFNTDLAINIGAALDSAFEQKVSQRLAPALQQVIDVLVEIKKDRGTSNDQVLTGIVSEFKQSLSGAAGAEMSQMAETFANLRSTLAEAVASMANAQSSTAAHSTRLNLGLEETLHKLQTVMEDQATAMSTMMTQTAHSSSAAVRGAVEEALGGMSEMFRRADATAERTSAQLAELVATSRAAMDEQVAAVTAMMRATAAESQSAVSAQLNAAGSALARGSGQQAQVLEATMRGLQAVTETWRDLLQQTNAVVRSANDTAASFNASGERFAPLTATLQTAAKTLGDAQSHLAGQVTASRDAVSAIRSSVSAIEANLERTTKVWDEYGQRFEGVDDALGRTFQDLDEGLARYAKQVREYLSDVDKNLGAAASSIASAVSPLSEELQDLPSEVKQFGAHVDKLREALERSVPLRGVR